MKKHAFIYAFLLVLTTIAVSCKKDTEVNKDTFKIENEKVEALTQSVKITGTYAYLGAIDGITLELGRQADLMDGDAYRTLLEGTDFSVEVKNLRTNTTYYYRYSVDYGGKAPYRTEIKTFKTEEYNLPEVKSKEVVSVGVNRAEVSGEVLSDGGGDAVTLRGICWSMSHNPSVGDEYANAGEGIGTFTCELTNLQPEKTYYARAFAGNSKGVSYGEELTLVTLAAGSLAEVKTIGITGNANLQATVSGEVTNEGTSSVIERGVCYGKEHYPTTSGLHVSAGLGSGEFNCQLTNLEANATYYVRSYAINGQGISYGDEMSFEAQTEVTAPVVFTGMVSDITVSSATGHGTVVSDGGATVTRRGLCWSMEHEPTTGDIYADCGNGVGEFSGLMPHLEDLTTYYVRAYAENSLGIVYGEEVSFTVGEHEHPIPPMVTTSEVTDISTTTAVGGGNVIDIGGAEVTERGICWSTSPDPTIEGNHTSNGTGTGAYTCMMTDLTPGTLYYIIAYAINDYGLGYGEQREFVTEAMLPTFILDDVSGAIISYSVTDDGGAPVEEHGVCYSTSHNPTISDSHVSGGSGTGSFTVELTDLQPGTTYYWRLYATNSAGTAFGQEYSYTTEQEVTVPTVTTSQVTDITQTTAIGGGNVTDDGGAEVTERGLCWSTDHNPTMDGNHATNGSGTGEYSVDMTELTVNTTYYVRAYAINSVGVSYGEEVDFITSDLPQYTIDVSASSSNGGTVSGGGTYQQGQSCTVTATANYGYTFTNWTENGSVVSSDASYTFTVTEDRSLVAHFELNNYTISVSANPSEGGVVNGGGTYQHGQSCTVTATANTGYSFTNWTENGNVVSTDASHTFTVTDDRSLVANFNVSNPGDTFIVDFENGMPDGWVVIDANNDGYTWTLTSDIPSIWTYYSGLTLDWYHSGTNAICSGSYINGVGAVSPDEYLVSPMVNLAAGSQLSFWVAAIDESYPADHFGVFVSDNGTSDWTSVQEWTLTGKKIGMMGGAASRNGEGLRVGNWYNYTVDLSAFVGQKYVAFRHFNCTDQYIMCLDDIELSNAKK